jgi:hypothetical protein
MALCAPRHRDDVPRITHDDRLGISLGPTPRVPMGQPFDELYTLILKFIHIKRAFSILYLISENNRLVLYLPIRLFSYHPGHGQTSIYYSIP